MKRGSRIISLCLALTLVFSLLPSALISTVFAAEEVPKYIVTSDVGWASEATDTTKPYLTNEEDCIINGTSIDYNSPQVVVIENYGSISETLPLSYVEVDGLKIYGTVFESHKKYFVVDTSSCPNLNGRTVEIRLRSGRLNILFDEETGSPITQDIKINFVFQTQSTETEYKLNATAGENGKILETKYLYPTDDGNSVYGLWVRPDNQYQLLSYTMGSETVPIELKNENYVTWKFSEPDDFGRTYTACNYFELEIQKDSDITLNFGPGRIYAGRFRSYLLYPLWRHMDTG